MSYRSASSSTKSRARAGNTAARASLSGRGISSRRGTSSSISSAALAAAAATKARKDTYAAEQHEVRRLTELIEIPEIEDPIVYPSCVEAQSRIRSNSSAFDAYYRETKDIFDNIPRTEQCCRAWCDRYVAWLSKKGYPDVSDEPVVGFIEDEPDNILPLKGKYGKYGLIALVFAFIVICWFLLMGKR